MGFRMLQVRWWVALGRRALALALLLAGLVPAAVRADLVLYPTRVVFDGRQRSMQVELINNGQDTATYRISLVNRRMSETGEFTAADPPAPGEQFADALVRYSPRQVVLAPGASQTVRLLVRRPAELAPGEYRSHLQFERVPDAVGATDIRSATAPGPGELAVQLQMLVGISIPVIVRQGETSAQVRMEALRLEPGVNGQPPVLSTELHRTGNRSVYGDLVATFTDASGQVRELGRGSGVAVYTPNTLRRVRMALQPGAGPLGPGTLTLVFRARPDEGSRVLAESSLRLP